MYALEVAFSHNKPHDGQCRWFAENYVLGFVESGCSEMRHESSGLCHMLQPGFCYCLWPKTDYSTESAADKGESFRVRNVHFNGTASEELLHTCGFTPQENTFDPSDPDRLHALFRELNDAWQDQVASDTLFPLRRLLEIVDEIRCQRHPMGPLAQIKTGWIARIQALMEEMRFQPNVEELARELGVSVNTLRNKCLRQTGLSTQQYLDKLRMNKAQILLKNTDHKIQVIAEMCGYKHVRAFHRRFMAVHHLPPGMWRERPLARSE